MDPKVIESYGNVKIVQTGDYAIPKYILMPPDFSEEEKKILKNPRSLISDFSTVRKNLEKLKTSSEKESFLKTYLREKLETKVPSKENLEEIITHIMDEVFMGYGKIGELMRDDGLEEIMINGIKTPVHVFHRRYGMCITNLEFNTEEELKTILSWLSKYAARPLNKDQPLLDAHMPDGSRVNAAIPPASPYGPSITIRKFKRIPYNVIELIQLNSISYDLAAFLWVCVEGFGLRPCDILIAGGAGSGKTTLLNALAMFIPKTERVITVEDTLELNFNFMENWVALEASPDVIKSSDLNMHALLKNSLRMRPDRVIVGEVRGREVETLLVAMDIGLNGSMGTIHANNARETTIRLMDAPMNVPVRMIPLIDLIVVMNRIFDRNKGLMRRVTQIAEISGVEKDVVQMGDIYLWNMSSDEILRTDYPILLKEKIAKECGITKKRLNTELYVRERVLKYMVEAGINHNSKVIPFFQRYHRDPKSVIDEIKESRRNKAD